MLSWLTENAATVLISAALAAAVIAIICGLARGRGGCSCGGDCAACGRCKTQNE